MNVPRIASEVNYSLYACTKNERRPPQLAASRVSITATHVIAASLDEAKAKLREPVALLRRMSLSRRRNHCPNSAFDSRQRNGSLGYIYPWPRLPRGLFSERARRQCRKRSGEIIWFTILAWWVMFALYGLIKRFELW
jgi:hypothetical protein